MLAASGIGERYPTGTFPSARVMVDEPKSRYYHVPSHVEVWMKSERVTFLTAPEFKSSLQQQATAQGISVGELVRRQFEQTAEEAELAALAKQLKSAVRDTQSALQEANRNVAETLAHFAAQRARRLAA
jgi:hypothetical protein